MDFELLRQSLLDRIRSRVYNGEFTERGLAKLASISQPHMHNVLNGSRVMSLTMANSLLRCLKISLLDLIDLKTLEDYLSAEHPDCASYSYLPVLSEPVGPSAGWPSSVGRRERFPIPSHSLSRMWEPVVARLTADPQMVPLFCENDLAILDQSHRARAAIDPGGLYLLKIGGKGLIRRLHRSEGALWVFTEVEPESPEKLCVDELSIPHFVRARATLIAREREWTAGDTARQNFLAA